MSEIDVTKCENYKLGFSGYICIDPNLRNGCSLNDNCKFKQLARKTQECEELKNKLKYIRDENIHLKESATDEQIDFLALNNYIKTLKFQFDQLKAEKEQAEQKLEQIRDIADKDFCHTCWETYENQLKQILQIIDEVE